MKAAAQQREELAAKLRTDSAFENPLESILENPLLIPDYMASEVHMEHKRLAGKEVQVQCHEVLALLKTLTLMARTNSESVQPRTDARLCSTRSGSAGPTIRGIRGQCAIERLRT